MRIPNVLALLTLIVALAALATYVVPSGAYTRERRVIEGRERTVVVPGTYRPVPKHLSLPGLFLGEEVSGRATPVGLHELLTAIPRGLEQSADIIFFIFIIGGVFGVLERTGTIVAVVHKLIEGLGHSSRKLTVAVMLAAGVGGSTLGMGEELIPLVPLFLLVSKRLGYDRIYGLSMVLLGAQMGFAAATTNPFTIQVAQGIAELPLASGLGLRLAFFACTMSVTIAYVLRYGARLQKDPRSSLMADDAFELSEPALAGRSPLTGRHLAILGSALTIFFGILWAVQTLGWWMADMGGGFLLIGLVAAFLGRLPLSEAAESFASGMREMVVPALVVGWARAIQVVLDDGLILDTLIHSAASVLVWVPPYIAVQGMLMFQTGLNFLIPSGSGQAAVTMPIMAPLADVLGISRQTAVFAFQCGDGLSNTIIPTSGVLMAMLALAKIPYDRWLCFVLPLFLLLMGLAAGFLVVAVAVGYR